MKEYSKYIGKWVKSSEWVQDSMCLVEKIEQLNTSYLEYRIFYKECKNYKYIDRVKYWAVNDLDNLKIVNRTEKNEFLNWHDKIKQKHDRERT